ncbi:unnamed protein product [Rotaria magnacalcarata]|uniref:Uncharacterized protein n=1 Tax=Rotaria magnacalcarata TaxID=392030 RepID=A0A816L0Y9_9BILA|nr:unnamed protein product [Rotaria magnacalcarata]CAF1227558.1 unnamed protein product [Rotaria magnacalcarata]CAF1929349.1 unnamed protein product [Rotaria magnacalcarata]CAF1962552.1 unnamed protein product [Rotaria magnacalcarata]CAF3772641.1 unnamed protein product [Rotaria magnacalcarata]
MPITTRAASLLLHAAGETKYSVSQTTIAPHPTQSCRSMSSTSLSCSSPLALLVSGTPSSDDKQNDSSFRDANAMLNVPIEDGDITAGTSQRGGRMIFLN